MEHLNAYPNEQEGYVNPGAGCVTVFRTPDNDYCIQCFRFSGKWKLSQGGKVEPGEEFKSAIFREYSEECFHSKHCLPEFNNIISYDFNKSRGEKKWQNYDYLTVGMLNTYFKTKEEIETYITDFLNPMAKLSCKVGMYLRNKNVPENNAIDRFLSQSWVQLDEETIEILKVLGDGTKSCKDFSEEQIEHVKESVSKYTEYSEFKLIEKEVIVKAYREATKEDNPLKLFTAEKNSVLKCIGNLHHIWLE